MPSPVAPLPHSLHPCMVTPPPTPMHGDPTPHMFMVTPYTCASAALLLCMHVHKNDQMTLQCKTLWAQVNYALSMPPCPTYTFHLSPFTPAAVLILLYIYINAQIITSVFKSSSVHQLCSSVITLVLHHTLDYWSTLLTPHICTHPTPVASLPQPLHPCMVTPPPTPVHGDPTPCTCAW